MPSFHNGAVEIAYLDEGEGEPIVLVHGFASTKSVNWVYPTWVSELRKDGRRVIALDNRGHGESSKLYDPAQYSIATMAGDVVALMDHLEIARADIMGYSMGGRMTAWLGLNASAAAALGDLRRHRHGGMIEGTGPGENVAKPRSRRPRSTTSPIPSAARSGPSPIRPAPIAVRSPPACAVTRDLMSRAEAARIDVAGPDRGRHHRRSRRLRRARSARSSRDRKCSIFPTATTCARSATRSTRPAWWISSHADHEGSPPSAKRRPARSAPRTSRPRPCARRSDRADLR